MPKVPSSDPLKFLVYRKFPKLIASAQDENGLGGVKFPYSEIDHMPTLETHEWPKLPKEAQQYLDDLLSKDKAEIDTIYTEELALKRAEDDKGLFFNKPNAEADFDYWSKMSEWKMDEALALSFSKNPEVVIAKRLEGILSYTSPFVEKYMKLKELAVRAKVANHFTDAQIPMSLDPIRPYKFVQWVQRNEIEFPSELAKKVLQVYEDNKPPKTAFDRIIEQQEKNTLEALSNNEPSAIDKIKKYARKNKEAETVSTIDRPVSGEHESLRKCHTEIGGQLCLNITL